MIDLKELAGIPKPSLLGEAAKLVRSRDIKACPACGVAHPYIGADSANPLRITKKSVKKLGEISDLLQHEIFKIVSRITNETVLMLGRPVESHPRNFVIRTMCITPKSTRPDAQFYGLGRIASDDITTRYQTLLALDKRLPEQIATIPSQTEIDQYQTLNNLYYDLQKGGGKCVTKTKKNGLCNQNHPLKSIGGSMTTHDGSIRQSILGKRVWRCARSIIAGNQNMRLDEVGISTSVAKQIYIKETVQRWNYAVLNLCYTNGTSRYPGSNAIIKRENHVEYVTDIIHDNYKLQIGDDILRNPLEGDIITFNRQPSLTCTSTSGMRVHIMLNTDTYAFEFNVISAKPFNADFDGDEMQIYIHCLPRVLSEARDLSYISNWLISAQNCATSIGQVQDTVVGGFLMTRTGTSFTRLNAMRMFNKSNYTPHFTTHVAGKNAAVSSALTGRDVMSMILPERLDFSGKASIYDPAYAKYLKYDPLDIAVKIVKGKLVSGVLDKKSIGPSSGNIYIAINNLVGADKTLEIMHSMQQMILEFVQGHGFTMSLRDIIIPQSTMDYVDTVVDKLMFDADQITRKLDDGQIIAPIGHSVEDYYEQLEINALSDSYERVLEAFTLDNGMFAMIQSGSSKGTWPCVQRMAFVYGQVLKSGERMRMMFSQNRTLPFFPQFDTSPESRGFIRESYLKGVSPSGYMALAMNAREDITRVALGTAVSGTLERQGIKNFEPNVPNYFGTVMNQHAIVQLLYADCRCDPRHMSFVQIPHIKMDNKEFEASYRIPADVAHAMSAPDKSAAETYFAKIAEDRQEYRDTFFKFEFQSRNILISDTILSPVNVKQIVTTILHDVGPGAARGVDHPKASGPEPGLLAANVKIVLDNHIRVNKRLMPWEAAATVMLNILIRSILTPSLLMTMPSIVLQVIMSKIELTFMEAFVDPGHSVGTLAAQFMSEPSTQSSLNTKWGMGKVVGIEGIDALKEIFGAKVRTQMKMPRTIMRLRSEYDNPQTVKDVANRIELLKLSEFALAYSVFFEHYGKPVHPKYVDEAKQIARFDKYNPLVKPPADLTNWCVRYELDQFQMVHKNITIQEIAIALRNTKQMPHVIYYGEDVGKPVIRVYLRAFKKITDILNIEGIATDLLETKIRGIDGIEAVSVVDDISKSYVDADGSIKHRKIRQIITIGINAQDMLIENPEIDNSTVMFDSLWDMAYYYGINAARQKMIQDLRYHVGPEGAVVYHHISIYADQLLYLGYPTGIEKAGLEKREYSKVLHRMASTFPIQTVASACLSGIREEPTSVSSCLMLGRPPKIGTLYSDIIVDEDFIKANRKSAKAQLDAL